MTPAVHCPLFDTERAERIESSLIGLSAMLTEVKATQEFWLGNSHPGEVQRIRDQVSEHHDFIVSHKAESTAESTLWGTLRNSIIPILAAVAAALVAGRFRL